MNGNVSREIEDLDPRFQPIVREALARCESRGLYAFITEGRRSLDYQACLYARGRIAAGSSETYRGRKVTTSSEGNEIVARCGSASYRVSSAEWRKPVTKVLLSWHILGFAVDLGFRSAAGKKDAYHLELERARQWKRLEEIYTSIDRVWAEVVPDRRWGNDWDRDGIPVSKDPDESLVDMPHWEWHPGRTLEQVAGGNFPAWPMQCEVCRNFRPASIERVVTIGDRRGWTEKVCPDCAEKPVTASARCVGVRT